MFPGMGGIDPRQMQQMMRQMGIKTEEVAATEVVIKKADGSELVVSSPQVTLMEIQGQKTFQVIGTISERAGGPSDEDVKLVMDGASVPREKALAALKDSNGDIAEAILKLQGQ